MALTAPELLGRARALTPAFAARALRTEELRAPLADSLREMIDAGLLATFTPRVYGGHQLPVATMSQIVAILSAACPSTGWVSAFYMGAAWRAMIFPEQCQRELFADQAYLLNAGQASPLREVKRVSGG